MSLTSGDLVAQLQGIEPGVTVLEHEKVLTVDALETALKGKDAGSFAKNLFLKDKNGKLFLVTALNTTEIDMKVFSLRLGLGKKQPRMAPAEALSKVLEVEAGCITPLALSRPAAKNVVFLMDDKLRNEAKVLYHPLRNDQSVAISTSGLENYLSTVGHKVNYVDFSIKNFKVGKDNPPDLKAFADAVEAYKFEGEENIAPATPDTQKKSSKKGKKDSKGGSKEKGGSGSAKQKLSGDDVHELLAELQTEFATLTTDPDSGKRDKLYKDLEARLNAFKNTAYTKGYVAAKTEIRAYLK